MHQCQQKRKRFVVLDKTITRLLLVTIFSTLLFVTGSSPAPAPVPVQRPLLGLSNNRSSGKESAVEKGPKDDSAKQGQTISSPFSVVGKTAQSARNIIARRRRRGDPAKTSTTNNDTQEEEQLETASKDSNHVDDSDVNDDYDSSVGDTIIPQQPSLRLKPRIVSLNVMIAGLSGLGKTTTCASLLDAWQQQQSQPQQQTSMFAKQHQNPKVPSQKTLHVDPSRQFKRFDSKENTWLHVRIIDTPGFGNRIDHRDAVRPILKYIHKCRRQHYRKETSPTRYLSSSTSTLDATSQQNDKNHKKHGKINDDDDDTLVHVCLYFLSPGRLLEMDVYFLKQIQKEVCIVPIIAKADTMTEEELANFRSHIGQTFANEGIVPYNFDKSTATTNRRDIRKEGSESGGYSLGASTKTSLFQRGRRPGEPLAIVSRDGMYPWGEVRSFSPVHSDLLLVRDLLLSHHTEGFVDLAHSKYGKYRAHQIHRRKRHDVLRYMVLTFFVAKTFGISLPGSNYVAVQFQRLISTIANIITTTTIPSSILSWWTSLLPNNNEWMVRTSNQPQEKQQQEQTHQHEEEIPPSPSKTTTPKSQKSTTDKESVPNWFLWLGGTEVKET